MVLVVILLVLGGANWYIAYRLYKGVNSFFANVRFLPFLIVFLVFALLIPLGFGRLIFPFTDKLKNFFGILFAYYLGIFIYLLLYTTVADFLLLIPRVMKLSFTQFKFFNGIVSSAVILLTLVTCIYGFINAKQIKHISYEICLENKTDISDINLVLLSDLHLGAVGSEERLEEIVSEINSLKPDIVCIAGDFFDTDFNAIRDPKRAKEALKKINSVFGVYACPGNHDSGNTAGKMIEFLKESNIKLLADEYTIIDERVILAGRLDGSPIGGFDSMKRKEFFEVYESGEESLPVIVMDHNPGNIGEYTTDADLILCGHTHKGQLFPVNFITNLMFDCDYGYYRKNSQSPHVIVTSGIGYWGMPMRVGTNCEIVSIRFAE